MLSLNGALTGQEIVQRIRDDFSYPVQNGYGGFHLQLSRDVGTIEAIDKIVKIHYLVEQIGKSEQPAVKQETTIFGTTVKGITSIGDSLYRVLRNPHRSMHLPNQQLSEGLNLWEEILHRVHGPFRSFSGDPIQPVNDHGVTEGELLNATATRIREGTLRKRYKEKRDQRRKDTRRICSASTKLITRLTEHHPAVLGLKIELMYRQDCVEKIRLKDSADHLQELIKALKDDPWFGKSIGYFWNRKFLSEAGYRTSLMLLFDHLTTPIHTIEGAHVIQEWVRCTMGAGLDYVLPEGFYNSDALFRYIECSRKTAQILRLLPDANFPHFGNSELPSRNPMPEFARCLDRDISNRGEFRCKSPDDQGAHLTGRFK